MNPPAPLSLDLATLVNQLFSQRLSLHQKILQQIQSDIEARQKLHRDILQTIDDQILAHRNRLLELKGQFQTNWSLWLHPRRGHLEQSLSDWHKQRLSHLTLSFEHLSQLRREYREAFKACHDALKTQFLLQHAAGDLYPAFESHHSSQRENERISAGAKRKNAVNPVYLDDLA